MNNRFDLNGQWHLTFTLQEQAFSTTAPVPGNIEPTLVKLGLLEDYLPADDLYATEPFDWVDDWCYTTTFSAPATKNRLQLVFEGIDTIAEIYLNGELLGNCQNIHIAYTFDVTDRLKGTNELKVVIRSSELWARAHCHDMAAATPGWPGGNDSSAYLRKARHQWGWDNAPRLLTSGIIRSVYLEELPPRRFEEVYLYTSHITESHALIGANWIYRTPEKSLRGHEVRLTLLDGEAVIFQNTKPIRFIQGSSLYHIPLKDIQLWWPAGFGAPKLYTLRLEILEKGEVAALHEQPFGIRTLHLERSEELDENGNGKFCFIVNGERVFARGTNWKPLSPLASEAAAKTKTGEALEELKNLHCNMVRIWGGGIYEDHFFYDFCDRFGIMVWQDFMLACEVPPTDEYACRLYAEEAAFIVRKLRNHPSLALWCGDNEGDKCGYWMHPQSNLLPSDNLITRKVLREAVLRHDPYRDYMASSPYMSDQNYLQVKGGGGAYSQPETHFYANALIFKENLRKNQSIFVGETGPMPVNAIAVNQRIFLREKARAARLWDSPALPTDLPHHFDTLHQDDVYFTVWRNSGRELCLQRYGRDFTLAEFKDYTLAVNLACADLYKDIIEYSRVTRPRKTGVLWWSLYDMWPMLYNYSVIDCDGNRKLPYHFIEKAQQEIALMATYTKDPATFGLYAANDTLQDCRIRYTVTAYDETGSSRVLAAGKYTQPQNATGLIQTLPAGSPALWILRWEVNGQTFTNHAFTGNAPYETMKNWLRILGKECGYLNEILELK